MARPEKVAAVTEIRDRLAESDAAVLTEYRGLTVTELATLRSALRPAGTDLKIFKNTLARRAATEAGAADLVPMLEGPTAIAYSKDPVAAAKVIAAFAKDNEKLTIVGGSLGEKTLDVAGIQALATLPSLDALRGKIIGLLQAPATKIAGVLAAPAGQVARVIGAYGAKGDGAKAA